MSIEERRIAPPPIHPLAALATLALDGVFTTFEIIDPLILLFTSIGLGVVGCLTTTFVQRYLAKDNWGAAVAKGLVMGVIAGVPYAVASTTLSVPLLIWAGVHQWVRLPAPKD